MTIFIRRVVEKTCFSLPPGPASLSESESGSSADGNCKQFNNKSLSQNEVTGGGGGTIFLGNIPTVVTYVLVLCSGRHFLHSIPRTTINLRKVPRARKWTTKEHFLASHHEETGVAEHSVEEKSKFRIFFFLPGEQLARGEVHRPAWIPEVSNFEFCPKRLLRFLTNFCHRLLWITILLATIISACFLFKNTINEYFGNCMKVRFKNK